MGHLGHEAQTTAEQRAQAWQTRLLEFQVYAERRRRELMAQVPVRKEVATNVEEKGLFHEVL